MSLLACVAICAYLLIMSSLCIFDILTGRNWVGMIMDYFGIFIGFFGVSYGIMGILGGRYL